MSVQIGEEAPDFELRDQHNQPVRLSDFQGKKHVTVLFYPWAFSSACDATLAAVRDNRAAYEDDDATLLAVSCDAPPTHRRQAHDEGYGFPLLSDFWPHGEAARRYGVFETRFGVARNATFLVDREGLVRFIDVSDVVVPCDLTALRQALAALA